VLDPAENEQRVVFMGDSITDMWAQPRFGRIFFRESRTLIGELAGRRTPQMVLRFRADVLALPGRNVVVILAGTNDLAGNTGEPITLEETEGT